MAKYTRLTYQERLKIRQLLEENASISHIARELRRSKSTICTEIHRKGMKIDGYSPNQAQADKKFKNKFRGRKKKILGVLKNLIYFLMIERAWSPEQISNHLKINYKEFSELHVSTEAIYQSVYSNPNRRHLIQALRWKKKKRGRRNRNGILRGGIKNRVSIHQRDKAVLKRIEVGHWESDLIVGSKNQGAIGTAVERVSRYTLLVHLDGKMTSHVVEKFGAAINTMPDFLKKSVTHDNGTEMAHHETLSGKCGILVFFADPGCPWQRPTNENTNGLLREFFPKGTDLRRVTEEELEKVQFLLNNRPRKCLGFKTPQQVIDELIKEKGNNKAPRI